MGFVLLRHNPKPLFTKEAPNFVKEAYMHYKQIGAIQDGASVLHDLGLTDEKGVVTNNASQFVEAVAEARFWNRDGK